MRYDRIGISAGQRLERALLVHAGENAAILESREQPWASATFTGQRHRISLRLDGTKAHGRARLLAARLPDLEFALPRLLVADIMVTACHLDQPESAILEIEALTIIED